MEAKMQNELKVGSQGTSGCKTLIAALVLSVGCIASALPAAAQTNLGTVSGTVSDPTGAKVPGAVITVTQVGTNYVTTGKSNDKGDYTIPFLNPGTYTVTVTAPTFKTETENSVVLTSGDNKEVDFSVKTGAASDTVTVLSENSLVDTGTADIATTLSQQEVTDLPNNGRNPYVLATLAAGVLNGGSGGYFQGHSGNYTNPFSGVAVQLITNGISGHNRLFLNGIPNDPAERLSGPSYTGFVPSPEAVQEVKVSSSIYDAQVGHGDGTTTNIVVKNGTNSLHGAAYYAFQNTYLNANLYQNKYSNPIVPRGNDQLNQTGFVVDGPVVIPHLYNGKDKTFFLFAFERFQSHNVNQFSAELPSPAELKGDFRALCTTFDSTGFCTNGTQLYVPNSPTVGGTGANKNYRTQFFPFNQIASAINPTGAAIASYFPDSSKANISGAGPFDINYNSPENGYESKYPSFTIRGDQQITQNNRLNVIYFQAGLAQVFPTEGFDKGIATQGYGYSVYRRTKGGALDDQHIFSPTTVLDTRFGLNYHPFGLHYPGENFDVSKIGIQGNFPVSSFPGASLGGNYPNLQAGAAGQESTDTTGSLESVLTKVAGAHTLKFGVDYSIKRYNVHTPLDGFGQFSYVGAFTELDSVDGVSSTTANPAEQSGDSLADLLLGYPTSGSYGINASYAQQQIYVAPFVQDSWRVSNKLTMTLGGRWDYEAPITERFNKVVNGWCFTCTNPLQSQVSGLTLNGGLTYANAQNRSAYPKYFKAFQPRVGLAYQLTPTTSLRAGYGIIYLNTLYSPIGTGYTQSTSYQGQITGQSAPQTSISNPFPNGLVLPTGNGAGLSTSIGQSPSFVDPNHVPPRSAQYTLNVQQEFPGKWVLQVAYVGANPNHLEVSHNIDILPAQYWNQGAAGIAYVNTTLPNPMAGLIPQNATLNKSTIYRYYLLLPYPQFSSVTELYSSIGKAPYNAMQIQVKHPMSHHYSIQGNFTWDKVIARNGYIDNYAAAIGKLESIQDGSPTMFGNIFGTLELPKLLKQPAWERLPIGGWKFNSVVRLENGPLLSGPSTYAIIGSPNVKNRNLYHQYNTCYETYNSDYATYTVQPTTINGSGSVTKQACDANNPGPVFQQLIPYQSQNSSPSLNLRQIGIKPLVDMSLFKSFEFGESKSFEIRGEYFNVFNTTEWGGPGGLGASNAGSAASGVTAAHPLGLLSQQNDARIGQLTARINF
jgi:hypothetical protein